MGNAESTESQKTSTSMREVQFQLHIAIDFGTDGCGIAFAYKNKVIIYDKWRSHRQRRNKTKTQILLRGDNKLICFGDNAKMMYSGADDNTSKSWKFFERFKMALYDNNITKLNIIDAKEEKELDEVDIVEELTATNLAKCPSVTVFVIAFKYLQHLAKEYIPKITNAQIKDEEIQWILTVPAIWSENAKNKIKQWIIKAGLVDESIIDQCIIVYEPDCAALSLQKEFFSNYQEKSLISNVTDDATNGTDDMKVESMEFKAGDKYILIDAGGGTVDVACHEILDKDGVEEIIHPTGDRWGSCYIDDLYITLLEKIFTKQWIEEYKEKSPGKFVEILENFQAAKCTFYEDKQQKTHDVQLPYEFLCFLEEKCAGFNTTPEALIKQFRKTCRYYEKLFKNVEIDNDEKINEDKGSNDVVRLTQVTVTSTRRNRNDEEYVEMDVKIWKYMFNAMINHIINHTQRLLNMEALGDKCRYLCLVGGFSASPYFQERMKLYFGRHSRYDLRVIIPRIPMLAVVEGAAYIGITRQYIKARRLKYTYGIKMFFNKITARKNGIDEEYIKLNTTSDGMVRDCFRIIARRNDRIALDEIKSTVSFKTSQISLIPILRSSKRHPKVATDGREESVLKIHHLDSTKEEIVTEFHFYGTMFTVYSYPKNDLNSKKRVDIHYERCIPMM